MMVPTLRGGGFTKATERAQVMSVRLWKRHRHLAIALRSEGWPASCDPQGSLDAWAEIVYLLENGHEYELIVRAVRQLGDTVPQVRSSRRACALRRSPPLGSWPSPRQWPRDDDSPLRQREHSPRRRPRDDDSPLRQRGPSPRQSQRDDDSPLRQRKMPRY
jgi:hypothetical protein